LRVTVVRTGLLLLAGVALSVLASALLARRMVTPVFADLERKVAVRTHELSETLDQQTAMSEILRVIASSPTHVMPVLNAIAERAARLCDNADALIWLVER